MGTEPRRLTDMEPRRLTGMKPQGLTAMETPPLTGSNREIMLIVAGMVQAMPGG
jgi:hypothetical protein